MLGRVPWEKNKAFGLRGIGGGVDLFYDLSGLKFKRWTAEPLGDLAFRRPPDDCSISPSATGCGDAEARAPIRV